MSADDAMKALAELKQKLEMNAGFGQMVQSQLQRTKINKRRSELTLEEVGQLSDAVPLYKQVGKAYFLSPMQQVVQDLKSDISSSEDETKRLTTQLEHAGKAAAAAEKELHELVQSHPELQQQIAAALG